MEIIGRNHSILEKIFIQCKTEVLLTCRLVCKLWAEEAGRILRKRDLAIGFRALEDIEEFLEIPRPTSQTFYNFVIDIPSNYPVGEESCEDVHPNVADLLECYGSEMKNLKIWYQPIISASSENSEEAGIGNELDLSDNRITFEALKSLQLLSNYVQQMTATGENSIHKIPKYFTRLSTPNLVALAIQHLYDTECISIVSNIIRSSSRNLEYLKIPAKPFPSIALDNSVPLENLRELDLLGIFHGFSCSTNETLDGIIKACPRLAKLGIEFSFRAHLHKIQELFQELSQTLEELRCTVQDRNLFARQIVRVDFIFPEMTKLKLLQMRWSNPGFIYYIDKLPQLKELMLDSVWTRKIQGNIFPNGVPFQDGLANYKELTSLKLSGIVNVEHILAFSKYFPNLKCLGCSFDSNESLRMVYTNMKQLTNLIIERKSNVTEAGGICGLKEDELKKLYETGQERRESDCNLPSIRDLKDLETLELCQLGATWCSLQFGIANLPKLKTLVIQSTTFKNLPDLTLKLTHLKYLTLWIRHKSEKLSIEETNAIMTAMPLLNEFNIMNHSLCGI